MYKYPHIQMGKTADKLRKVIDTGEYNLPGPCGSKVKDSDFELETKYS